MGGREGGIALPGHIDRCQSAGTQPWRLSALHQRLVVLICVAFASSLAGARQGCLEEACVVGARSFYKDLDPQNNAALTGGR